MSGTNEGASAGMSEVAAKGLALMKPNEIEERLARLHQLVERCEAGGHVSPECCLVSLADARFLLDMIEGLVELLL